MPFVQVIARPVLGRSRIPVLPEIAERAYRQPGFWAGMAPVIRQGPGSLGEQIEQRTFEDLKGQSHPWIEPDYARGIGLPAAAVARENVLWDAALGRGPGAITRSNDRNVTVGVNDNGVRVQSAAIGNSIVSSADYFGFVTGEFGERAAPARAKPGKGVRHTGRRVRTTPVERDVTLDPGFKENFSRVTSDSAMWWFLGFTFKVWLSEAQLAAGVLTPPKRIGPSARMIDRIRRELAAFIAGDALPGSPGYGQFGPSYTERARALDPRRGRQ